MSLPNRDELVADAKAQTGLADFGDTWFFANIDALIPSLNAQAQLSEAGVYGARHMITSALVNRLRHVQLIKDNPEILNEEVSVKAVLTGLPRTGSTMLHRMLASAPNLTGVRWYETQNYVPLDGEKRGEPEPRREAAKGVLSYMLEAIPELMSIHPMDIDQADEEVIIMGQLFSSSMIESTYFVPDYAQWLSRQDPRKAYDDLIQILQSLQWQDPSRKGKDWVLKTPGHLMGLGTVLDVFPDAKIVMTHRDPVSTIPSYCSMEASLYKMGSTEISNAEIGTYWVRRLAEWLDHFMKVRE
ncbi:MAG: sulfotransferase family protein, partial [Maricaulaceae bacterium]